MLSTLVENKVKGGRWHTLYDKVMSERNLSVSAMKVAEQRREQIDRLQSELKDESYRPLPVRRVEIP